MFLALMRKDLRLYRPAIVTALLLMLVFDGVMPAVKSWQQLDQFRRDEQQVVRMGGLAMSWQGRLVPFRVLDEFASSADVMLAIVTAFAAIFGGVAIAIERRERWANLPAMLPVSRGRRLAATFAAGGIAQVCLFALQACVLVCLALAMGVARGREYFPLTFYTDGLRQEIPALAIYGAAMFTATWMIVSVVRSGPVAAVISITLMASAHYLVAHSISSAPWVPIIPSRWYWSYTATAGYWAWLAGLLAATVLAFAIGTTSSLRRAEP